MRRTRTDYAINRYYSPDTGRFTSHDPLTEIDRPDRMNQPQGLNLYPYVMGAPTRYTDPDGLDWGMARYEDNTGYKRPMYFDGPVTGDYDPVPDGHIFFAGDVKRWHRLDKNNPVEHDLGPYEPAKIEVPPPPAEPVTTGDAEPTIRTADFLEFAFINQRIFQDQRAARIVAETTVETAEAIGNYPAHLTTGILSIPSTIQAGADYEATVAIQAYDLVSDGDYAGTLRLAIRTGIEHAEMMPFVPNRTTIEDPSLLLEQAKDPAFFVNITGDTMVAIGGGAAAGRLSAARAAARLRRTVFRVQGGVLPNASKVRFSLGANGQVTIAGDDMLFVNLGQEGRALEFLMKRGETAELVRFEVTPEFAARLRSEQVAQRVGREFPGRPQAVDATRAPDQFGIPASMFDDLLDNIVPGTYQTGRP